MKKEILPKDMTNEELVKRYHDEIIYTFYSEGYITDESEVFKELKKRGKKILPLIVEKLDPLILEDFVRDSEKKDWVTYWVNLIYAIEEVYQLGNLPYERNTKLKQMNLNKWIQYCKEKAKFNLSQAEINPKGSGLECFVPYSHYKEVCKTGQGSEMCRFLVVSERDGYLCAKYGDLKKIIQESIEQGNKEQVGDNCPGILPQILEQKELFLGHEVEFLSSKGKRGEHTLKNILIEDEHLHFYFEKPKKSFYIELSELEIAISSDYLFFRKVKTEGSFQRIRIEIKL